MKNQIKHRNQLFTPFLGIIVSLVIVTLTISCKKEFIIDIASNYNIIVVNSFFTNEEKLSVTVTRSMAPQDNKNIQELSKARVSLFKDDSFLEYLTYSKLANDTIGQFQSTHIPQLNSIYRIEVANNEMKTVTGQSSIPQKVEIESDSAIWLKWINPEDSSFTIRFYFEFTIPDPIQNNYYYFTISAPVFDTSNQTKEFMSWQYAQILTSDLPNHELYINNAILFKDLQFSSTKKKITGTATMGGKPDYFLYGLGNSYWLDKSKLRIKLHSLSKESYLFCSSFTKKMVAQDDIYAEPVVIYSNIENGLGLFAGENISSKDVEVTY